MRFATTSIWATTISPCSDTTTVTTTSCSRTFRAGGSLRIVNDRGAVNLTRFGRQPDSRGRAQADQRRQPGRSRQVQSRHQAANQRQRQCHHLEREYAGRRRPLGHDRYGRQRAAQSAGRNFLAPRRCQRTGTRRRRRDRQPARRRRCLRYQRQGESQPVRWLGTGFEYFERRVGAGTRRRHFPGRRKRRGPPERRVRHHQAGKDCRRWSASNPPAPTWSFPD